MTTITTTPVLIPPTRPAPWYLHRTTHLLFLFAIAALLAYDRFRLCTEYLFKYLDEDQACMWYAAHDLLHGRIAEPAFYGQDYNSLLEGFLAAPLVALHIPYNIACPLTTLLLGLLPFLLLAVIAARRGHPLTAAAALLIPLLMPIRYGMIAGIPRGFINGIAVATIPMILLLPPPTPSLNTAPTKSKLAPWLPALRYFFAAFFAVVALQVNPNCALLLVPIALYALLTRFRQWKLWLFTPLGLLAAAPYPWYVHQFYHVTHTDYILYLRDVSYHWGYRYFLMYLHFAAPRSGPSPVFADLVPFPISAAQSPHFLLAAFITLALLLLLRLRIPAFLAALSAIAITLLSFAYERVNDGQPSNTASYPYARMFLALPVLFLWLLFLLNHKPWKSLAPKLRWITPITLALLLSAGLYACIVKQQQLPAAIRAEINAPGFVICPAIPVAQLNAAALEIQRVAQTQHADLLIIGGGDREKYLDYAIPALLNLETLFPDFERRTFRLHEENTAAHDNILFIHYPVPHATLAGGGNVLKTDDRGNLFDPRTSPTPPADAAHPGLHSLLIPPIFLLPAHGSNAYHLPELRDRMPPFFTPDPTPADPHPTPLIDRPSW